MPDQKISTLPPKTTMKQMEVVADDNTSGSITKTLLAGLIKVAASLISKLVNFTTGSVPFATGTDELGQSNADFFWDNTLKRLGIGTNTPGGKLNIIDTVGAANIMRVIQEANTTGGGFHFEVSNVLASTPLLFLRHRGGGDILRADNNLGRVITIDNLGRIGIRTLPASTIQMIIKGQGVTSGTVAVDVRDNSDVVIFRVRDDGNVGIGVSSPSEKLDVAGNVKSSGVYTGSTGSPSNPTYAVEPGSGMHRPAPNSLGFGTFNTLHMSIIANGSVGIGLFPATSKLHVKSIASGPGSSALNIENSSAASLLFVRDDGNVGVGTSSPADSAILELASTTKAFMPPKMTTTQRDAIASPIDGMVIWNTTTTQLEDYNSGWAAV